MRKRCAIAFLAVCASTGGCTGTTGARRDLAPYFRATTPLYAPLYERFLRAMSEPAMEMVAERSHRAFRFTYLTSFQGAVAVRVEAGDAGAQLDASVLTGNTDDGLGPLAQRIQRKLTAAEWTAWEAAVANARFFDMPAEPEMGGLDGENWLLEGARDGHTHWVEHWSPSPTSTHAAFRDLCLRLLAMSGLAIDADGAVRIATPPSGPANTVAGPADEGWHWLLGGPPTTLSLRQLPIATASPRENAMPWEAPGSRCTNWPCTTRPR